MTISSAGSRLPAISRWRRVLAVAGEGVRTRVTVRVYQTAGISSSLEERALAEAAAALGTALVDVVWQRCTTLGAADGCATRVGPSELMLRIVASSVGQQDASLTLGSAVVKRQAVGVLATVYFSPVAWLARATGADAGVLLGRAAAHELGHLLMGTVGHPLRGLMRADWTQHEVRRNERTDWTFTASDIAAMRQTSATR